MIAATDNLAARVWTAENEGAPVAGRLSRVEWAVLVVGTLANLVPVWAFRYFAGQDTPNHLYAAEILRILSNGSAPAEVTRIFQAALGLKSNVAFHALLLGLSRCGLSGDLAHRIVLSTYAITLPLSALFALRAAAPRRQALALLFLPLVWNWFALQGLYNYILSLPPALIWLGWIARDRARLRGGGTIVLGAAALAVFFCHLGTFVAMLMITAVRTGLPPGGQPATVRARLRMAGPTWGALLPAALLALAGAVSGMATGGAAPPAEPTLSAWETYDVPMAVGTFFVEFAVRYHVAELAVLGLPLVLLLGSPFYGAGLRRSSPGGPTIDPSAQRGGVPPWPVVATLVLVGLYFLLPHIVAGSDASPRLRPMIVFSALCCGGVGLSRRARAWITAVALACGLGGVGALCASFATFGPQLDDFTSGIPFVREGARLYPLVFEPRSPSALVRPFQHAWGYYGVARHVVTPFAFAWHPSRFPYRYRELPLHLVDGALPSDSEDEPFALTEGRLCASIRRFAPSIGCDQIRRETEDRLASLGRSYDYLLTWRAPLDFSALLSGRGYRLLHAQGQMALYQTPAGPHPL